MTQNYKLSQKDYEVLAGASWPCYTDYLDGKMTKRIAFEINKYERDFYENLFVTSKEKEVEKVGKINEEFYSINSKFLFRFLLFPALPAIIGLWLFFYLGGSFQKFILVFLLFRFANIMWISINHKWLCHHQFEPKLWARPILLFFIVVGIRTSPAVFIKAHIAHHRDIDTIYDPYPPTWGFLNNALVNFKYFKNYPFGRWMVAPDIKFVLRNMFWLRLLLWIVVALIDIDIFLLSFFFLEVYNRIGSGIESFTYHDGFKTKQPVDRYPYLGYFIMIFLGESWIHESHHKKPWVFNNGNSKLIDIEYQLLRLFGDPIVKQ